MCLVSSVKKSASKTMSIFPVNIKVVSYRPASSTAINVIPSISSSYSKPLTVKHVVPSTMNNIIRFPPVIKCSNFSTDDPPVKFVSVAEIRTVRPVSSEFPPEHCDRRTRYDGSLAVLTQKFCELLRNSPDGTVNITYASELLNVAKRRIYDITNVLEGINLVQKIGRCNVQWRGDPGNSHTSYQLLTDLQTLQKSEKELDRVLQLMKKQRNVMLNSSQERQFTYLSHDDLSSLATYRNKHLILVKTPSKTRLEVSRSVIKSEKQTLQSTETHDVIEKIYQVRMATPNNQSLEPYIIYPQKDDVSKINRPVCVDLFCDDDILQDPVRKRLFSAIINDTSGRKHSTNPLKRHRSDDSFLTLIENEKKRKFSLERDVPRVEKLKKSKHNVRQKHSIYSLSEDDRECDTTNESPSSVVSIVDFVSPISPTDSDDSTLPFSSPNEQKLNDSNLLDNNIADDSGTGSDFFPSTINSDSSPLPAKKRKENIRELRYRRLRRYSSGINSSFYSSSDNEDNIGSPCNNMGLEDDSSSSFIRGASCLCNRNYRGDEEKDGCRCRSSNLVTAKISSSSSSTRRSVLSWHFSSMSSSPLKNNSVADNNTFYDNEKENRSVCSNLEITSSNCCKGLTSTPRRRISNSSEAEIEAAIALANLSPWKPCTSKHPPFKIRRHSDNDSTINPLKCKFSSFSKSEGNPSLAENAVAASPILKQSKRDSSQKRSPLTPTNGQFFSPNESIMQDDSIMSSPIFKQCPPSKAIITPKKIDEFLTPMSNFMPVESPNDFNFSLTANEGVIELFDVDTINKMTASRFCEPIGKQEDDQMTM